MQKRSKPPQDALNVQKVDYDKNAGSNSKRIRQHDELNDLHASQEHDEELPVTLTEEVIGAGNDRHDEDHSSISKPPDDVNTGEHRVMRDRFVANRHENVVPAGPQKVTEVDYNHDVHPVIDGSGDIGDEFAILAVGEKGKPKI